MYIDSANVVKTNKLEKLQERILRLIEYSPIKENRIEMDLLKTKLNIVTLRAIPTRRFVCDRR